jgi:hypothetical protein
MKGYPSTLVVEIFATWYVILLVSILFVFWSLFLRLSLTQQFGTDKCLTGYSSRLVVEIFVAWCVFFVYFLRVSNLHYFFRFLSFEMSPNQQFGSEECEVPMEEPSPLGCRSRCHVVGRF